MSVHVPNVELLSIEPWTSLGDAFNTHPLYDMASRRDHLLADWLEDPYATLKRLSEHARTMPLHPVKLPDIITRAGSQLSMLKKLHNGAPVILTGQQPGLGGGPLFTLYKALTVLRLCQILRMEGIQTVPMFWVAGEDSDIDEASAFRVLSRDSNWHSPKLAFEAEIGSLLETATIQRDDYYGWVDEVAQILSPAKSVDIHLPPQATLSFVDQFRAILEPLVENHGMIFVQPSDLTKVHPEIAEWIIDEHDGIMAAVDQVGRRLEAKGWPVPLKSQEHLALFHIENGRRHRLFREGHELYTDPKSDTQRRWYVHEYKEKLRSGEVRWGPNVMTRPILQDVGLNTLAYIAGPTELAYHAQLRPLYPMISRTQPVIWPRSSVTLIEPASRRIAEKLGWDVMEPLHGRRWQPETDEPELLRQWRQIGDDWLQQIAEEGEAKLGRRDPAFEKSLVALRNQIGKFMKTAERTLYDDEERYRKLHERLIELLIPRNSLQERNRYLLPMLMRHGTRWVNGVMQQMDVEATGHQLMSLT